MCPSWDKYLLVAGNYQAGISVVDFSDPANAREIAFADPAPLLPPTQLGGDWSSYWYDGLVYESDITRGLIIWELAGPGRTVLDGRAPFSVVSGRSGVTTP
ncbi:MAG TPA: hypothetical protein VHL78_06850 [Actinomycetota bacterium]|nr:hypothetical protein [Actinomycetota bacterium]